MEDTFKNALVPSNGNLENPLLFLMAEVRPHQNLGTMLRLCAGFGANGMIIIGSNKYGAHGAHGAQKHVPVIHFYDWKEAVEFTQALRCTLYGINNNEMNPKTSIITPCLVAQEVEYSNRSVFVLNNTGYLSADEIRICAHVITLDVPCCKINNGVVGIGSIKYEAVVGICLNYYSCFKQHMPEREFKGEKFKIEFKTDHSDGQITDDEILHCLQTVKQKYEAYNKKSKTGGSIASIVDSRSAEEDLSVFTTMFDET